MWKLLGGTDRPIRAYAGGFFLSDSIVAIADEARQRVAEGFSAIKMRCGATDRGVRTLSGSPTIRDAVGADIDILVDVVQGWTHRARAETRPGDCGPRPHLYRGPLTFDDIEGMARSAAALDVPIAAGENDYGRQGFRRLLEARAVDIAMIDLQRAGGIPNG